MAVTVGQLRKLALALPDTIEKPSYGTPGFRHRDTLFARLLDSSRVVVRVEPHQREVLLAQRPKIFSITPHYADSPWVIVSLKTVSAGLMRDLLVEAARQAAPVRRR